MSTLDVQFEQEANAFFRKRLGASTLVLRRGVTESALDGYLQKLSPSRRHPTAKELLRAVEHGGRVVAFPLCSANNLFVGLLTDPDNGLSVCLSVLAGPTQLACQAVASTIEAWELAAQLATSRAALRSQLDPSDAIEHVHHRFDAAHRGDDEAAAMHGELPLAMLEAMSSIIDARDHYTRGHSDRVARIAYELARKIGLSEAACQEVYLSGIVHDIGKIGIPDAVLLKEGKLTEEEFSIIKRHPEIGYRIIERLPQLQFALPVILHHHERWDGLGYPHGLIGEATPLLARVVSVADAFDAMTSSRVYRGAMSTDQALAIICKGRGTQWDTNIAECLMDWALERRTDSQQPIEKRTSAERAPLMPPHGIIPQNSSVEYMHQALATLSY